ncbi:L,D-transpeptidase [Streptomyces nitrosporeus]|uniref:L,D-transpeptidase n=1 Tax=Streptomyces nitrosporeus TaxID=28894 RepID=UPI00332D4BE0
MRPGSTARNARTARSTRTARTARTATALTLSCLTLLGTAATAGAHAPAVAGAKACTAGTGPYQRPLEKYLGRPVDGTQSTADCEAIRAFQVEHDVETTNGYASLATYRTMVAAEAADDPNADGDCPVRKERVTCVDLDRQLLWVQTSDSVDFGPVPIRSGRDTEETRLGWHSVYWRSRDHVSTIYNNAPMPYSQFFDGGQAIHGRLDPLYDGGGSAGCVNLSLDNAEKLWNLLDVDDLVYIWGAKPGTAD